MIFFIDFEANAGPEFDIIQLGCMSLNGRKFSTLVYPSGKLNWRISKLTGITNHSFRTRTTHNINSTFELFSNFVQRFGDGEEDKFYCYGTSDIEFLGCNMHRLTTPTAKNFAKMLSEKMTDMQPLVMDFYGIKRPIKLIKLIEYYNPKEEEVKQLHDSEEDARFLRQAYLHITSDEKPAESPFPEYNVAEMNGMVGKQIVQMSGDDVVNVFTNYGDAVDWIMENKVQDRKSKRSNVSRTFRTRVSNGETYYGYSWKVQEI